MQTSKVIDFHGFNLNMPIYQHISVSVIVVLQKQFCEVSSMYLKYLQKNKN